MLYSWSRAARVKPMLTLTVLPNSSSSSCRAPARSLAKLLQGYLTMSIQTPI